jgi:hypothetical protein
MCYGLNQEHARENPSDTGIMHRDGLCGPYLSETKRTKHKKVSYYCSLNK